MAAVVEVMEVQVVTAAAEVVVAEEMTTAAAISLTPYATDSSGRRGEILRSRQ